MLKIMTVAQPGDCLTVSPSHQSFLALFYLTMLPSLPLLCICTTEVQSITEVPWVGYRVTFETRQHQPIVYTACQQYLYFSLICTKMTIIVIILIDLKTNYSYSGLQKMIWKGRLQQRITVNLIKLDTRGFPLFLFFFFNMVDVIKDVHIFWNSLVDLYPRMSIKFR